MEYNGKFICIGLNPSFDLTISVDELSDDFVNRAVSEYREAAGVATNIARNLHRLQLTATVAGIAGENNLREYMTELCRENIPCSFIKVPGSIRENITLLVGKGAGAKTIKINRAGPTCTAAALAELRGYFSQIASPDDTVIFGGSCPPGISTEAYASLMEYVSAMGMRVVVDTDVLHADHYFRIKPWLIKPNEFELERICSTKFENEDEMIAACKRLIIGGVDTVLLTRGEKGLISVTRHQVVRIPPAPVKGRINTVGAGDAALSGYLCADAEGRNQYECSQFAAAFAASVISENE